MARAEPMAIRQRPASSDDDPAGRPMLSATERTAVAAAADVTICPKFAMGWNHRRSRKSAGATGPRAAIVAAPITADPGPKITAAVNSTMIDGLAKRRSLTSTVFHSKYTKAAANAAHSSGSGNVCHGMNTNNARIAMPSAP